MSAAPGIAVREASLSYGGVEVFAGLDLDLRSGVWTCLLGASGVGKSSVLRYLAGLHGDAVVRGRVETTDSAPLQGRVAYMAQRDLLFPWAPVLDNVLIGYRLRGERGNAGLVERARAMLDRVGLADRETALPAALSGGMRQRVALARTLLENRPVVLMDEPFSALDALTRYRIQDLAVELLADKTVLLVTHDPMEALRIGHDIHVMSGSPARLEGSVISPSGRPARSVDDPSLVSLHGDLLTRLGVRRAAA